MGIFGYPLDRCATVMLATTLGYLRRGTGLKRVVFCLYEPRALEVFAKELQRLSASFETGC